MRNAKKQPDVNRRPIFGVHKTLNGTTELEYNKRTLIHIIQDINDAELLSKLTVFLRSGKYVRWQKWTRLK